MRKTEAFRAITTAYTRLQEIDSAADLKKNRLTLTEYDAARETFADLTTPGSATDTFLQAVADFFRRAGFIVTETATGYRIRTDYPRA